VAKRTPVSTSLAGVGGGVRGLYRNQPSAATSRIAKPAIAIER